MSDLRQWMKTKQLRQPDGKIPNHTGPLRVIMCIVHKTPLSAMFGTINGANIRFDCYATLDITVEQLMGSVDCPEITKHFTCVPYDISDTGKALHEHTNVELYEGGALHAWYMKHRTQRTLTEEANAADHPNL